MGHIEELAVGLADTLPCPMLLRIDWPYLREVLGQTMKSPREEGQEEQQDMAFIGIGLLVWQLIWQLLPLLPPLAWEGMGGTCAPGSV